MSLVPPNNTSPQGSPAPRDEVANLPLHQSAVDRAIRYIDEFEGALIVQSKLEAYRQRHPEVVGRHVEQAYEIIRRDTRRSAFRDGLISIGGAIFGAGVSALVAVTTVENVSALLVWISVGLTLAGIVVLVWGMFGVDR